MKTFEQCLKGRKQFRKDILFRIELAELFEPERVPYLKSLISPEAEKEYLDFITENFKN
jgi:hypothetical protein